MKSIEEIANEMGKRISRENTEPTSNTEFETDSLGDPNCPYCHGIGYVQYDRPVGHPDFGKVFPCTCRMHELQEGRASAMRGLSNLESLERYTFESFHPQGHGLSPEKQRNLRMAYETAHAFAKKTDGWLLLIGDYGCGKTHLAAAIANVALGRGELPLFVTVPDLLDHLRAAYSPSSEQPYSDRFEQVRTAPLLILDDLGTENTTSWALEKLFQLLNHRYMSRLPTVITTNHELERMDARLRSRLADATLVDVVHILAPDYRQAGVGSDESDLNTLRFYSDYTFDSFHLRSGELDREGTNNLKRALTLAQEYASRPQGWVMFTGTYGSGKTHLAAAIANERVRLGYPALFIVVPDLLDHLRATFSPQSNSTYDQRFDEVRRAPFLVLDDLGTESATAWAREKLFQLLNRRFVAQLPTVITTSKGVEDLDPKLQIRLLNQERCQIFAIMAPPYMPGQHRSATSYKGRGGTRKRRNSQEP